MKKSVSRFTVLTKAAPLEVGFLAVNDCAPLVVAHEFGLFKKYDLNVMLRREASWKRINDKIVHLQLDAAHAPATLPFLNNLGLTEESCACATGLVLSLQGNAITISRALWKQGVRDAQSLKKRIIRDSGNKTFTFGVVFPFSSQYFLLCQWLRSSGIGIQVRIVNVPPSQMFPMLKLGYLDGYCVGEPWTSLAVEAGVGVCVATSALLAPLHPEKVLLVRREFAKKRPEEHERLIAALLEACEFCDQPENRGQLSELLARREYVNAPAECIRLGLMGPVRATDNSIYPLGGLNIFHNYCANEPTTAKADWITSQLYKFFRWTRRPAAIDGVFCRDIFRRAQKLAARQARIAQRSADSCEAVELRACAEA